MTMSKFRMHFPPLHPLWCEIERLDQSGIKERLNVRKDELEMLIDMLVRTVQEGMP